MWKIFVHFAQTQNRLARTGSEPLMKYCYKQKGAAEGQSKKPQRQCQRELQLVLKSFLLGGLLPSLCWLVYSDVFPYFFSHGALVHIYIPQR